MDRLFGLDMQLLMDALQFAASVLVLFALGSYLLFNPVRKLLKDRQDGIKKDIDDAAADKESAKELKDLYEGKLKEVDKEAEQILSEARQKALKNEARIIDEAKEEAARIIKRANEEAVLEKKRAMDEVKHGNDHDLHHDGSEGGCSFHRHNNSGYACRRNVERNG